VYYGALGRNVTGGKRKWKMENSKKKKMPWSLSFVAVWALLGIKPIGSNAEHIVALDADTMDDRTDDGTGLG
jgi:hypothetical protein